MPGRETDVPGSRLLLRSDGRFCRGVPPAWPAAGVRGTPMIRGWRLSPARIQVLGACGIWIVLAWVLAAGPLRRARPSAARQDDEPRAACTCGQRCQRHGGPEDPVGGMCGVPAALGPGP